MKYALAIVLPWLAMLLAGPLSCKKEEGKIHVAIHAPMASDTLTIRVHSRVFAATLLDTEAAQAFKALLPLTLSMMELNGNEKYGDLPRSLPVSASNPGTIRSGDLMLYGSKTLVLFYKTFATPYSYTKLGAIQDTAGLASALGAGNASLVFEIK
jgi:hypothetical protein